MALLKSNKSSSKFALLQIEKDGGKFKLIVGPSFAVMVVALIGAICNKGPVGSLGVLMSGGGLMLLAQFLGRWWYRS